MPTKPKSDSFDFPTLVSEWPLSAFSNWAFAEREDRMGAKAFDSFQKLSQTMWTNAGKAFEDQMDFVSHRLHEDFEFARALSQCNAPEETIAAVQDFYAKMSSEYQTHFETQAALLRESFTENAAVIEDLNETAIETVNELSKAAEESLQEVQKPAPRAKRTRVSAAK